MIIHLVVFLYFTFFPLSFPSAVLASCVLQDILRTSAKRFGLCALGL